MSWKDRFLRGSFRGVPFRVEDNEGRTGRRLAIHEYPGKDDPWPEDLGRRTREYEVKAYVIGPDYDRERDALIEACEAAGPATLVHPWLGTFQASCQDCKHSESTARGGMATFELVFVRAAANRYPAAELDTAAAVAAATSSAEEALAAQFAETWWL